MFAAKHAAVPSFCAQLRQPLGHVPEWSNGGRCKRSGFTALGGSNPPASIRPGGHAACGVSMVLDQALVWVGSIAVLGLACSEA